uniref:Transmembrane protein n=1 Tax=Rhabditophanes sp. KR3021 TaxID=114890 RepID=A0AC35UIK7_9BILA
MCCSWNSFLNVLGNRQQRYVETLRKLKINMVLLSQKLCVLETEFENFFIREESIKFTMVEIDVLIQSLNNMLGAEHINIPPEESSNWRSFTLTLVRLNRLLAERQQHSDSFQQMKGKVTTVENLLRTIETKTERRWWLRDLLNLAQLLIKAAMIIMSSISVAYNTTRFYAIITLAIIISSSLIELMDKCFLQHIRPKDIPTLPVDTPTLH